MILVSYTNARGETVVLDDTERTFLGELYGREGCEAPTLEYVDVTYGDGSTETLAIKMKPRDVTLYFWAPTGKPHLREMLEELKSKLIQTGTREGDWGQLMIRRSDGHPLYLNCAYTGGLDEFIRNCPNVGKFALDFHAQDALFYDGFEQSWKIQQNDYEGYLFFQPLEDPLYFQDGETLFFKAASGNGSSDLFINGDLIYPQIIITGPAENIKLTNKTTGRVIQPSGIVLGVGETITIETKNRRRSIIMKNSSGTKTNIVGSLTAKSSLNWWLTRGSNDIEFQNTATTPESSVRFVYKEGFLSCE